MAEFASAVQAVRCAVAIQRMAARRNGDLSEDRRVVFRIGLNLGDVVARGDDLLGDGVNVAARLQALAEPEEICISALCASRSRARWPSPVVAGRTQPQAHCAAVRVYALDWALPAPVPVAELRNGALPLPDRPSIAVLPFANMSQDAEQEYFADGLSEDLITALASIAGSSSSPATRASATRAAPCRSSRSGASSACATCSRAAPGARATACG